MAWFTVASEFTLILMASVGISCWPFRAPMNRWHHLGCGCNFNAPRHGKNLLKCIKKFLWFIAPYSIGGHSSLPLHSQCWFTRNHWHDQCCIFQSYAKTVLSRMKLTMWAALTTTRGHGLWRYFYSALVWQI